MCPQPDLSSESPAVRGLLAAGLEAQQRGDLDSAYRHFLQAARLLLIQAKNVPPHRRQARVAQGNALLAQAEEIRRRIDQPTGSSGKGQPVAPLQEGGESTPEWLLAERPAVRLADVAGLNDVKEQLHLKLILPFTFPEEAARYGIRPGGGILLYGPPGTGKTYIARAVAGELDADIFVAKASNLMSQWFGKAEQNIAALFSAARRAQRAVIFLDEFEALVPKRSATHSSVMPRVIAEFLTQTQSLGSENGGALLLLGATNEPWAIDPAALRPGRFDELIYVGLPDLDARLRLLELGLAGRPLDPSVVLPDVATRLTGYSGADITYLCTKACERAFLDAVTMQEERPVTASDFEFALAERRPSVTTEQVRRYERFRLERQ